MARLDGLGEDLEEKIGKLAGEVNNLDVKMTNNVTALGQYLITTQRSGGGKSFLDILEKQQSQDKDSLLTLTIEMYSVFGEMRNISPTLL